MMRLLRYLFPPLRPRQRLPLLSRAWSSEHDRGDPVNRELTVLIQGHGLARTSADAARVARRYRGESINDIVRQEKRKRRREPKLAKAWRRFKQLW